MEKRHTIIFDEVMLKQLKGLGKKINLRSLLTKMLNKVEEYGPRAGNLLDSALHIYEIKSKHPPIRLYFKPIKDTNEIYIFEYEIKTSEEKQQKTITRIKFKILNLFKKG